MVIMNDDKNDGATKTIKTTLNSLSSIPTIPRVNPVVFLDRACDYDRRGVGPLEVRTVCRHTRE